MSEQQLFSRKVRADCAEPDRPSVGVVTPSYQEGIALLDLLATLVDCQSFDVIALADSTTQGDGRATAQEADRRFSTRGVHVLLDSPRGRAVQMNHGAQAIGNTDIIAFVHADTELPDNAAQLIRDALGQTDAKWGRFDVRVDGDGATFRVIETMMNLRSRFTGMCTGDQVLFIRRDAFDAVGGFPEQALMEDIEISKRLRKRYGLPCIPKDRVITSARRWQKNGVWRTITLMWGLRLAYFFGVSPDRLSRWYANVRG